MALTNEELADKIDRIPEELIKRLDDRYYKKEDADKIFLKKETFAVVSSVLSFFIFILGVIGGFIINVWTALNGR